MLLSMRQCLRIDAALAECASDRNSSAAAHGAALAAAVPGFDLQPLFTIGPTVAGPVGFDSQERPFQFVFIGNGRFVLRDVRTGEVRREFYLAGDPATGYDGVP